MSAWERRRGWTAFAALFAIGTGMAWLSWRKWPDTLIDCGRDFYFPWQILQGRVLYRDLAQAYGPFSLYFNAFLFRVFGVHLLTLALFNHLLIALLAWLIFRIFRETAGFLSAFFCSALFLSMFAFSQYTISGNYNYVCPYAHEILHSAVFAWTAIWTFVLFMRTRADRWLWATALLWGLVLADKVEIFLALSAALAAGFGLLWLLEKTPPRAVARDSAILAAGLVLPSAAFFLYFCAKMPAPEAAKTMMIPFTLPMNRAVHDFPMFPGISGMADPKGSLLVILKVIRWHAVLLAGLVLSCFLVRQAGDGRARRAAVWVFWIASAAALAVLYRRLYWVHFFRPLPLYLLLAAGTCLRFLFARRDDPQALEWLPRLVLSIFALLLLLKIFLRTHILLYGFVLALPGTLILAAFLLRFLPEILDKWFGPCGYVKPVIAGFLATCALWYVVQCRSVYRFKTFPLGRGADLVYELSPRKDWMEQLAGKAVEKVEETVAPGQTLAVFPSGLMINYWTRRPSSVGFQAYRVFDFILAGGEDRVVETLDSHPPDFVILLDMDASTGHGDPGRLGRDYGFKLLQWIRTRYQPVYQAAPPDRSSYGMVLLRRAGGAR